MRKWKFDRPNSRPLLLSQKKLILPFFRTADGGGKNGSDKKIRMGSRRGQEMKLVICGLSGLKGTRPPFFPLTHAF